MEPIPESLEAAAELDPEDDDVLDRLLASADEVLLLVPRLIGLSLATNALDATFTVVSTSAEVAAMDAVQYLSAGPCVDTGPDGPLETTEDLLFGEERWRLFAATTAAQGVRSTLTLPLLGDDGSVAGTINIYGGDRHSFRGLHDPVAAVFGAWAPGAVTNADLSFSTRLDAMRAPRRIRERNRVETGIGILAASLRVGQDEARRRLHEAAARAGVDALTVADVLIAGDDDIL